ncbi:hypothetical protein JW758_04075 [Candidatus Peregrinibacteria bacterium]|nr:hypothetical protein [Candidatus Peregrinibacteria bacterium]
MVGVVKLHRNVIANHFGDETKYTRVLMSQEAFAGLVKSNFPNSTTAGEIPGTTFVTKVPTVNIMTPIGFENSREQPNEVKVVTRITGKKESNPVTLQIISVEASGPTIKRPRRQIKPALTIVIDPPHKNY